MMPPRALTILAIPKPFRGTAAIHQRNAIESWRRLRPAADVLLLGDEEGTAEAARELGADHEPRIACDEFGTPLLSAMLEAADRRARTEYMTLVNADILLTDDFPGVVAEIPWDDFVLVGGRLGVDLPFAWDFDRPGWSARLRAYATQRGELHAGGGSDYFVYRRGFWRDVPPFVVGRPYIDNWLMFEAVRRGVPLVDLSPRFTCIHQDHDYAHIPGGEEAYWRGVQTLRHRRHLGGLANLYRLADATHVLTPAGVVQNDGAVARESERLAEAARRPGWVPAEVPGLFGEFTNIGLKMPAGTVDLLDGRA